MRSPILKHCAGRNYNSPLNQAKKGGVSGNLEYDTENRTINPSLEASYKNLSVAGGATQNLDTKETTFGGELKYENKKGFNMNAGVTGSNMSKPTISAGFGLKF